MELNKTIEAINNAKFTQTVNKLRLAYIAENGNDRELQHAAVVKIKELRAAGEIKLTESKAIEMLEQCETLEEMDEIAEVYNATHVNKSKKVNAKYVELTQKDDEIEVEEADKTVEMTDKRSQMEEYFEMNNKINDLIQENGYLKQRNEKLEKDKAFLLYQKEILRDLIEDMRKQMILLENSNIQ